jgi:acyl carrier protein
MKPAFEIRKLKVMIMRDFSAEVKKIISEKLGIDEVTLAENQSFHDDLGIDSLDLCEVIWEVEKKFKVSIPDEEMENLRNIGELIEYLDQRRAA